MGVILESQLESLIFHTLTLDFLSSLWTWAAVITTALGVWRIRTADSHSPPFIPAQSPLLHKEKIQEEYLLRGEKIHEVQLEVTNTGIRDSCGSGIWDGEAGGVAKGKFTLYLEENVDFAHYGGSVDEDIIDEDYSVREVTCSWEGMVGWRREVFSWYHYQDLSALDGSIVRLWDDQRRGCSI